MEENRMVGVSKELLAAAKTAGQALEDISVDGAFSVGMALAVPEARRVAALWEAFDEIWEAINEQVEILRGLLGEDEV